MNGQSVAEYGMKLESILQKVYDTGILIPQVRNDMLRAKLWSGLRDSALKNVTRYNYDIIKNFDELRKEVRAVELELEISGASKPENTATHQPLSAVSDMSELWKTLELLNKRLDNFESELKKVNNKVHVTMGIIIEVHIEKDLIRIKAMKEEGDLDTEDLVEVK